MTAAEWVMPPGKTVTEGVKWISELASAMEH